MIASTLFSPRLLLLRAEQKGVWDFISGCPLIKAQRTNTNSTDQRTRKERLKLSPKWPRPLNRMFGRWGLGWRVRVVVGKIPIKKVCFFPHRQRCTFVSFTDSKGNNDGYLHL